MIIAITQTGALELQEPNDFKGFKIAVENPGMTDAEIAAALDGVATPVGDDKHFWVSQAALKAMHGNPQTADWTASFEKMVEKVKPFGWIDEATGNIRGHIERV